MKPSISIRGLFHAESGRRSSRAPRAAGRALLGLAACSDDSGKTMLDKGVQTDTFVYYDTEFTPDMPIDDMPTWPDQSLPDGPVGEAPRARAGGGGGGEGGSPRRPICSCARKPWYECLKRCTVSSRSQRARSR